MTYQWYQTDPLGVPGQPVPLIPAQPLAYSRSAPNSPYHQGAILLPTPPVAVSPLPQPVYLPYGYSPGQQTIPLQPSPRARPTNLAPVLLDLLNYTSTAVRRQHMNPHLNYDLRDFPSRALVRSGSTLSLLSDSLLVASILNPATTSIKVISKAFPWEIDVESADDNSPVTLEDLITSVHASLDKHITGSEWWIVTEDVRTKVSSQYSKNCDSSSVGEGRRRGDVEKPRHKKEGLRRIDWLLDNHVMKGLEKDDQFISTRIRDPAIREKTWVLVTGQNK